MILVFLKLHSKDKLIGVFDKWIKFNQGLIKGVLYLKWAFKSLSDDLGRLLDKNSQDLMKAFSFNYMERPSLRL